MINLSEIANKQKLLEAAAMLRPYASAGIDQVSVMTFCRTLRESTLADTLIDSILDRGYKPEILRLVQIPKADGNKRDILIPIVQDRAIQKMIVNGIEKHIEVKFHNNSYGFRPKRNVQQAVLQASQYVKQGYGACILLDLKNFFGLIDIERLRKLMRDEYDLDDSIRSLINAFMRARITDRGRVKLGSGVPAGIPLAPMLAVLFFRY